MTILIMTIIIVALLMTGMALGLILNKKPLKGSCGGMSALGMDMECDICGGDKTRCETAFKSEPVSTTKTPYYDPMKH